MGTGVYQPLATIAPGQPKSSLADLAAAIIAAEDRNRLMVQMLSTKCPFALHGFTQKSLTAPKAASPAAAARDPERALLAQAAPVTLAPAADPTPALALATGATCVAFVMLGVVLQDLARISRLQLVRACSDMRTHGAPEYVRIEANSK